MSTTCHKQSRLAMLLLLGCVSVGGNDSNAGENTQLALVVANKTTSEHTQPTSALSDNFEARTIDPTKWWMRQAHHGHYWIEPRMSRVARKSIAISVDGLVRGCGQSCQRNEIREAPQHQIKFGEEAWYSFSFRLTGATSTSRWVSGQWKQQSGGSPFLAQRFNRGVYTITVQDDDCRVVVASSDASAQNLPVTQQNNSTTARIFPVAGTKTTCKTDIRVQHSANHVLPDPYRGWVDMNYRVRGGRNGKGLIEIWANGRFIARVTGSIGDKVAAGPYQYFKFGIYRNFTPGPATAYLDNYTRIRSMPVTTYVQGDNGDRQL